jgi:hypothetical protein
MSTVVTGRMARVFQNSTQSPSPSRRGQPDHYGRVARGDCPVLSELCDGVVDVGVAGELRSADLIVKVADTGCGVQCARVGRPFPHTAGRRCLPQRRAGGRDHWRRSAAPESCDGCL